MTSLRAVVGGIGGHNNYDGIRSFLSSIAVSPTSGQGCSRALNRLA